MADLQRHRIDIERAITDGVAGRDELFNHLMSLPADARAKVSPKVFSRLSEDQLRALLGGERETAPSVVPDQVSPPNRQGGRRWRQGIPLPPFRTAMAGALVVALLGGGAAFAIVTTAPVFPPQVVRSIHAATWPPCPRLGRDTDGCVYTVQNTEAAFALSMTAVELQGVNPSISTLTATLPAQTRLIVWRGRGILTK